MSCLVLFGKMRVLAMKYILLYDIKTKICIVIYFIFSFGKMLAQSKVWIYRNQF